jgi:hypothetical protein
MEELLVRAIALFLRRRPRLSNGAPTYREEGGLEARQFAAMKPDETTHVAEVSTAVNWGRDDKGSESPKSEFIRQVLNVPNIHDPSRLLSGLADSMGYFGRVAVVCPIQDQESWCRGDISAHCSRLAPIQPHRSDAGAISCQALP